MDDDQLIRVTVVSVVVSATAGILNLIAKDTNITGRKALARGLTSGVLGLGACSVILLIPDVHALNPNTFTLGIAGLSSILGSLGTSGIEVMLKEKTK